MMSLIPPSIIILPLVLIIVYWLNQRHERKLKDSFDELIEPVERDNLFDLPAAQKPSTPIRHEPYVPPANSASVNKDDLSKNRRLNAVIEQAETNISRQPSSKRLSQIESSREIKAKKKQQLQRVEALKAQLAEVQARKKARKTPQNHSKITQSAPQQSELNLTINSDNRYQALKPNIKMSVKK